MLHHIILQWSGGKDSALALYHLQQQFPGQVKGLLTTVGEEHDRVTMHGVPTDLIRRQADSLGLPLHLVRLPEGASLPVYNQKMNEAYGALRLQGADAVAAGDIFLEDLRQYREQTLTDNGFFALFPLWGMEPAKLVQDFIAAGFKARVVAANARFFDEAVLGRELDEKFLESLPEGVDPAGENGEYHTFVYDGPNFKFPVKVRVEEKLLKTYPPPKAEDCFKTDEPAPAYDTRFWFADLVSVEDEED